MKNQIEPTVLSYLFCFLLDFPENNNTNIEYSKNYSSDHRSVKCPITSKFHAGGQILDTGTPGHKVSLFIWVLILIVGILGVFGNCVIILILRKQYSTKPFQVLLSLLAFFDLVCCTISVVSASGLISFFENWDRGSGILHLLYIAYFTTVLGRSGSTLSKVFIAVERYVFISNPDKISTWLSKWRTRILVLVIVVLAIILNLPRYFSIQVIHNYEYKKVFSVQSLDWLMLESPIMKQRWFRILKKTFQYIDFWVPLPILMILIVLIRFEIKKITSKKRALQVTRQKDIREVQMFIPVIIILFLCSILPIAHFTAMEYTGIIYREHVLASTLFFSMNSAANLPIYCWKGSAFRKELRAMLFKLNNHQVKESGEDQQEETPMTSLSSSSYM